MWNAVRAVLFLAMSPLGVLATEPYAGLRTPSVQGVVAVGEAQHVSANLIACTKTRWMSDSHFKSLPSLRLAS